MEQKFKKQIVDGSETIEQLAKEICGYGHFAYENDDCEHPIPRKAVEEYLSVGVMFADKKLKQLKQLADAMYSAAQYLTTDASRLHKTMEEYRQFIIHQLNK